MRMTNPTPRQALFGSPMGAMHKVVKFELMKVLNQVLTMISAPPTPPRAAMARAVAGQQVRILMIGDSYCGRPEILFDPWRALLIDTLPSAGPGWVVANNTQDQQAGVTRALGGSWSDRIRATETAISISNEHRVSQATGASMTVTLAEAADSWMICYEQKPGGGSFTWAVDGGGATTIDTDGAQQVVYAPVSTGGSEIVLSVTVQGTEGVTLGGVLPVMTAAPGVVLHKCGVRSARATHFAGMAAGYLEAGVAALEPDVLVIYFSTVNERSQSPNVPVATFKAAVETIIARARSVRPQCDVILIGGAMTQFESPITPSDYELALVEIADLGGHGVIRTAPILSPYAAATALGIFDPGDLNHPTTLGGTVLARHVHAASFAGYL